MSQENIDQPCPICGEKYLGSSKSLEAFPGYLNDCERCGTYKIDSILIGLSDKPWSEVSHLVSAWIRRENKSGITPMIGKGGSKEDISNPEWWKNKYQNLGFPTSTIDKMNKLLQSIADTIDGEYDKQFSLGLPHYVSEVAAKDGHEIVGLTRMLDELGYIDDRIPKITAKGWIKIDDLRKVDSKSNSAFIAMWFSEVTSEYRNAVIAAVEFCGYKPIIVDQEQYSDFIMNQVITFIRQAKFVIADFTCLPEATLDGKVKNGVRGGVYWESGMAYGLGKPLIHTCEDSTESKDRIHFDVDQYNTLYWEQEELSTDIRPMDEPHENPVFAEKLVARILALVGKGSYKPE